MYHFIEKSIRGRISSISTRHAQDIIPPFSRRTMQAKENLIYLEANNLYGWEMSQLLPTYGFRFLQQGEIDVLKLQELSDDAEDGYNFTIHIVYTIAVMTIVSLPSHW